MNMLTLKSKSQGFTLVELMIAITIGLIILAVLSQVFVSSKQTYRVQEALSRLQENGRYAVDFMGRDIRKAGYAGCVGAGTILNTNANPVTGLTLLNPTTTPPSLQGIIGYEQASVPAGFPVVMAEVKTNTDVIEIQSFSATGAKVITPGTAPGQANIHIANNLLNLSLLIKIKGNNGLKLKQLKLWR